MFSIALLIWALAADVPPRTVTWAEVDKKTPQQLSRMFLPPAAAANVIDGKLGRIWLPGQSFGLSLWTASRPAGPQLCHRVRHGLDLKNTNVGWAEVTPPDTALTVGEVRSRDQYATTYPRAATLETCAEPLGYLSPPENEREAALEALDRLVRAIDMARQSTKLPFALECRADDGDSACSNQRQALASLPLDVIYRVSFWTVDQRIRLYSEQFGPELLLALNRSPPAAEIEFGPSPPNGRSWRIMTESVDGRLSRILMRRTTVIYH